MAGLTVSFDGEMRTKITHSDSNTTIPTDVPTQIGGQNAGIPATDLMAVSVGSCVLTMMSIAAKKKGLDLSGATATVEKKLGPARLEKIETIVKVPREFSDEDKKVLENFAHQCPCHKSLHPDVEAPISFSYGE